MEADYAWWAFFFRWLHVLSGVMWIGLLWYFNFVQIPSMPKIPDEQKPAISKVIAGFGFNATASTPTRSPTTHFSLHVVTNSRYFSRLSKNRNGLSLPGAAPSARSPLGVVSVVVSGMISLNVRLPIRCSRRA